MSIVHDNMQFFLMYMIIFQSASYLHSQLQGAESYSFIDLVIWTEAVQRGRKKEKYYIIKFAEYFASKYNNVNVGVYSKVPACSIQNCRLHETSFDGKLCLSVGQISHIFLTRNMSLKEYLHTELNQVIALSVLQLNI